MISPALALRRRLRRARAGEIDPRAYKFVIATRGRRGKLPRTPHRCNSRTPRHLASPRSQRKKKMILQLPRRPQVASADATSSKWRPRVAMSLQRRAPSAQRSHWIISLISMPLSIIGLVGSTIRFEPPCLVHHSEFHLLLVDDARHGGSSLTVPAACHST